MFEVYVMKGTIAHGVLRTGSKEEAKKLTEKLLKKGEDAFLGTNRVEEVMKS